MMQYSFECTDDELRELRAFAEHAGDHVQVLECDRALAGWAGARYQCASVIRSRDPGHVRRV